MNDTTPDRIKDLLEKAINNSTEAWVAQTRYFDDLVKRNIATFSTLSDARVQSLKEIGESQSFNEAFEANIAYEDSVREELQKMNAENSQAWENLQVELQAIYTPTDCDDEAAA